MKHRLGNYDVIIIGGGHAGCEAAAVASRMGASVGLVSFLAATIGTMSCNPAIGGVGKGHLVREVDAMDGLMARAADQAGIHYRMLNASKGNAVRGPRVQADRRRYANAVQIALHKAQVEIIEDEAVALHIVAGRIQGVVLRGGVQLVSKAVVLATGTFLKARMFRGREVEMGGRAGERSALRLSEQLNELRLPIGRLKTGTPPRLDGRTIAWERLARQPSDAAGWTMSPLSKHGRLAPQIACAITRTNPKTHDIIRDAGASSPLRSGAITGAGPRYCPSIEDKVARFGDRDGHQIFLEPEGLDTHLVYPNGISTSLAASEQSAFVRSIDGLEDAVIVEPGYAVEYDYIDPRVLDKRLALRDLPGLFLAGQVNGTTGYEEAAAQGLVAGLNAAAHALGRPPVIFQREDSYIGVMIDDLTIQGVTEPYRMLTARAEFRLKLRADNAETRLTGLAMEANCLSQERKEHVRARMMVFAKLKPQLEQSYSAGDLRVRQIDVPVDAPRQSLADWLRFPNVADKVDRLVSDYIDYPEFAELLEDALYGPYLSRQLAEIASMNRDRSRPLADDFDFDAVAGLSNEMKEKLRHVRPANIEEASRIRGITPAAVSAILVASMRKAA